jgi:hypothetical protein
LKSIYLFEKHSSASLGLVQDTEYPTTYQTRHFFNNSETNEDTATRFEQDYVRCVRNKQECVCSVCLFRCNIFIGFRIIKEMAGLVGSGTPYITLQSITRGAWGALVKKTVFIFVGYNMVGRKWTSDLGFFSRWL